MKRVFLVLISVFILIQSGFCQENSKQGTRILFHGLIIDASTFYPLSNSQIVINRIYCTSSGSDGTFAFYVNRNDTIVISSLGYKSTNLYVSDTLSGREFNVGIYMHADTLKIGEVIIVPRFTNLKSEILNGKSKSSSTMENARYNVALSAYQGRNSQGVLGDPSANYKILSQRQKVDAYERGGIPSDKILGLSPFLLLPAAYLILHGAPEKPAPIVPQLSDQEVDQMHKRYLETLSNRK